MTPTWHPRTTWVPPAPAITGLRLDWTKVDTVVIHYTADDDLIDGDPGEHEHQLDDYLRAIQTSYMNSRGYSIGYNVPVDWLGGQWEARGFDIKCAANRDHNDHTFAILMLVDGADRCTDEAAASVRNLIGRAEDRADRELVIVGHGQLQKPNHPTGCPGAGLRAQIAEGVFSPRWQPPRPIPPTPIEEDEMLPIVTNAETFKELPAGTWKWALMDDGQLRWMDPVEYETRGSKPGTPWMNDSLIRHGAA